MHRLAAHLSMTVERLLDEMGSDEVTNWIAVDNQESFETRAQWPMAMLACMYANRYRKKDAALREPKDFLYGAKDETRQRQTKAVFAVMDSMAVDKKDGPNKT